MMHRKKIKPAALTLSLLLLSGCRPSPALTEIIYDDKAEVVESEAPVSAIENREENTEKDDTLSPNAKDEEADNPRDRERLDPAPTLQPEIPSPAPLPSPAPMPEQTYVPVPLPPTPVPEAVPGPAVRQIVDAYGRVVELPEQLESLIATRSAQSVLSILQSGQLSGSLPDIPVSEFDFTALLAQPPQACVLLSGQNVFSEGQLVQLDEAGTRVVVLPALDSGEHICQAVSLAGELLGGDAPSKSAAYRHFYEDLVQLVGSRVKPVDPEQPGPEADAVYTLYLDSWDDQVTYQLHDDAFVTLEGVGLPVAATGRTASPIPDLLALSGVCSSSALAINSYSVLDSQLRYVCPIDTPNKTLTTTGGLGAGYDRSYLLTTAGDICLGDEAFHSVILPDRASADKLAACPLWTNYGPVQSATGLTSGYGFLDQNGDIVTTSVRGDYDIHVLPDPSWGTGSPDSILLPLWSACRIRGVVAEEELRSRTAEYYLQFYDRSMTEDELTALLEP